MHSNSSSPDRWIVYQHVNLCSGKSYIGMTKKTIEERWEEHLANARAGSHVPVCKAIRATQPEDWEHKILVSDIESQVEAGFLETKFIAELKSKVTDNGYNCTDGGDGFHGGIVTEETRQKLSDALTGRVVSSETREKIRRALTGRERPTHVKEALSKAHKGKRLSEEHKAKLSRSGKKDYDDTRDKKVKVLSSQRSQENRREAQQTKEYRDKRAKIAAESWKDPDKRQKRIEAIRAGWAKRRAEREDIRGLQD